MHAVRPSSRRRARSLIAATALTLTASSIAATPRTLQDGLSFTYTVTSTSSDKSRREATNVVATVRMQGGNVRMDYTDGKGPMGQKGAYILFMGAEKQFAIVNEKEKQAMIMSAESFGSGAGALLNNPLIRVTMSDVAFSYEDKGAGETILGYPTRHVRVMNRNTVEVKIPLMTRKSTTVDTTDQWIATGIGLDEGSLLAWARAFGAGVKSTNAELGAAIEKYNADYGRSGIPLKTVTYSTIIDNKGKATRDTVTMLVTDLKKGSLDAALFTIPSGFEVVNLSDRSSGRKSTQ